MSSIAARIVSSWSVVKKRVGSAVSRLRLAMGLGGSSLSGYQNLLFTRESTSPRTTSKPSTCMAEFASGS